MTDAVHSFHAPIYADTSIKRLPPSFYWGVGFAILLHLILAYYLLQQNFSGPTVAEPDDPRIIGTIYNPPPPEPPKPDQPLPKKVIDVHQPLLQTPPLVPTAPLVPVEPDHTSGSTSTPPTIGTAQSSTGTTSSTSGGGLVKARWTQFPNGDALADYYPAKAAEAEREGVATVQCTVLDAKGHVGCTVVSETPGGFGFGAQTVKMVQDKGRVDITQGDVKIGSVLRTTVKWQLG